MSKKVTHGNEIVAFTYNVCWGCMTSDPTSLHNKTATTLA